MARIRTIKPEFWRHEDLSELPEPTHMLAAQLLNYADDEGYFNANPKLIKAEVSPLREPSVSIHDSLTHLSRIGYLRLGKASDGRTYGHIVAFLVHQVINRKTDSKIKELDIVWEGSLNTHTQLTESSHLEGKGKEGKGSTAADLKGKPAEPLPRADDPALEGEDFPLLWLGDETSADRQLGWLGAIVDELPERDRKPVTDFTRMAVAGKILSDAQAGLLETLFHRHKPAIVAESNRRIGKRFPGVDAAAAHPVHGKAINRAMAARDDAEIDRLLKLTAQDAPGFALAVSATTLASASSARTPDEPARIARVSVAGAA